MYDVPRVQPGASRLWRWWATSYLLAALISALAVRLVVNRLCAQGCGAVAVQGHSYVLPPELKLARGLGFLAAALVFTLTITLGMVLMSRLLTWRLRWRSLLGSGACWAASSGLLGGGLGFIRLGEAADAHPRLIGTLVFSLVLLTVTLPVIYGAGYLCGRALGVDSAQYARWSRRQAGTEVCAWLIFAVAVDLCGPEDITLAYVGWAVAWTLFGLASGGLLMPLLVPRS